MDHSVIMNLPRFVVYRQPLRSYITLLNIIALIDHLITLGVQQLLSLSCFSCLNSFSFQFPFELISTMDPNLDRIPNLNAGQLPQARLVLHANNLTIQNKRGVVRTRMTARFTRELLQQARQNPNQRLRVSDRTLRKAACATWLWCRRYCRYDEHSIKRPAMLSWLRVHMRVAHPGVFDDADVLAHITDPSMKGC